MEISSKSQVSKFLSPTTLFHFHNAITPILLSSVRLIIWLRKILTKWSLFMMLWDKKMMWAVQAFVLALHLFWYHIHGCRPIREREKDKRKGSFNKIQQGRVVSQRSRGWTYAIICLKIRTYHENYYDIAIITSQVFFLKNTPKPQSAGTLVFRIVCALCRKPLRSDCYADLPSSRPVWPRGLQSENL